MHLVLDECAKVVVCDATFDGRIGQGKSAQIFLRNVDAAFLPVDGNILPKVCQLQCGAGVVGQREALGIPIAAGIEDKPADRVRRVFAVGQQLFARLVASYSLILPEGDQEVCKRLFRNVTDPNRLRQCDEYRMLRPSGVAIVELLTPVIE